MKNLLFFYFVTAGFSLLAQDAQFSQPMAITQFVNPALVGLRDNVRVSSAHRMQYMNVDNGFNSSIIAVESGLNIRENYFGARSPMSFALGIMANTDQQRGNSLENHHFSGALGVHTKLPESKLSAIKAKFYTMAKSLGLEHPVKNGENIMAYLSVGINMSYYLRQFSFSEFTFNDQIITGSNVSISQPRLENDRVTALAPGMAFAYTMAQRKKSHDGVVQFGYSRIFKKNNEVSIINNQQEDLNEKTTLFYQWSRLPTISNPSRAKNQLNQENLGFNLLVLRKTQGQWKQNDLQLHLLMVPSFSRTEGIRKIYLGVGIRRSKFLDFDTEFESIPISLGMQFRNSEQFNLFDNQTSRSGDFRTLFDLVFSIDLPTSQIGQVINNTYEVSLVARFKKDGYRNSRLINNNLL